MKIHPTHAELIILLYHNVKNALESAEALMAERNFPTGPKYDIIDPITKKLKWIKAGLEFKIPKERQDIFNTQLKHADTLRLNEINRLYTRLTPEKQEILEKIIQAMIKGEILNIKISQPEEHPF